MSLPQGLPFETYAKKALLLFKNYSWSYNFKGIEILHPNNISKVPEEFVDFCNNVTTTDKEFLGILHCDANVS